MILFIGLICVLTKSANSFTLIQRGELENRIVDFVLTALKRELGFMNHRTRLDKRANFTLCLFEEHRVYSEKIHFLLTLFLLSILEFFILDWLHGVIVRWLALRWVFLILWLAIELIVVFGMESLFKRWVMLPLQDRANHWKINFIPLLLCMMNSCVNIAYLFFIEFSESFIIFVELRIIIFAFACLYVCSILLRLKKIVKVDYNPTSSNRNQYSIGFGDIIIVKRDGTVHVLDEAVESLDIGYENEILLVQDYSYEEIPMSELKCILFVNGRDFNKAVIPDLTTRSFKVKDLFGCSTWSDYSVRTDSEILRVLGLNSV